MAWLTPYVINGAKHTAALFRRQAQRPATDQAGVSRPGDLKVTQLPAAATGFRIAQGGLSLPSRFPGRGRESYGVENADAAIDITDVDGTGSSTRRDAVVVEVLDPNYLSIPAAEAAAENYMRVHVVQAVPVGATSIDDVPGFANRTAYVLAFINWPANTTAITNAMIRDARELANPKRDEAVFARPRATVDDGAQMFLTAPMTNGGEYFPGGAGVANQFSVHIPAWATRMVIDAAWISVMYDANVSPFGRYWIEFGTEYRAKGWANKHDYEYSTQEFWFNAPLTNDQKSDNWLLADEVPIPAKLRGKTVTFVFKAGLDNATAGKVWMTSYAGLKARLTYAESALDANIL